jgi:hypothetical protein
VDIALLDPTLTVEDIEAAVRWTGMVAGIGRFRPANGGFNGRFKIAGVSTSIMK